MLTVTVALRSRHYLMLTVTVALRAGYMFLNVLTATEGFGKAKLFLDVECSSGILKKNDI